MKISLFSTETDILTPTVFGNHLLPPPLKWIYMRKSIKIWYHTNYPHFVLKFHHMWNKVMIFVTFFWTFPVETHFLIRKKNRIRTRQAALTCDYYLRLQYMSSPDIVGIAPSGDQLLLGDTETANNRYCVYCMYSRGSRFLFRNSLKFQILFYPWHSSSKNNFDLRNWLVDI